MFYRVSEKSSGSGLGLYIVKETIEKLKDPAAHQRAAKAQGTVVLGTVISNPDKTLWPADDKGNSYSKADLAHYLEQVGSWMIPNQ